MFLGTQELFLNRALSSKEHFKTIDTYLELKDISNMLQHILKHTDKVCKQCLKQAFILQYLHNTEPMQI